MKILTLGLIMISGVALAGCSLQSSENEIDKYVFFLPCRGDSVLVPLKTVASISDQSGNEPNLLIRHDSAYLIGPAGQVFGGVKVVFEKKEFGVWRTNPVPIFYFKKSSNLLSEEGISYLIGKNFEFSDRGFFFSLEFIDSKRVIFSSGIDEKISSRTVNWLYYDEQEMSAVKILFIPCAIFVFNSVEDESGILKSLLIDEGDAGIREIKWSHSPKPMVLRSAVDLYGSWKVVECSEPYQQRFTNLQFDTDNCIFDNLRSFSWRANAYCNLLLLCSKNESFEFQIEKITKTELFLIDPRGLEYRLVKRI
jgi:hypothetical protein